MCFCFLYRLMCYFLDLTYKWYQFLFIFIHLYIRYFFLGQLFAVNLCKGGLGHYSITTHIFCMQIWIPWALFFFQRSTWISTAGLITRQRVSVLPPLLLRAALRVDKLSPPDLSPFSRCHDQELLVLKSLFFGRGSFAIIFWECGMQGFCLHTVPHAYSTCTVSGSPSASVLIWGFIYF